MTRSLSANFRRVRDEIEQFGQDGRDPALAELDNLTQRVPIIKQIATRNFDDVYELLVKGDGKSLIPTPDDLATVVDWALEKRAPFHRSKNSVADALLLTMYAASLDGRSPDDRYCFVSGNVKDFSAVDGDNRLPHPDLADLFADPPSEYFLSLVAALAKYFPTDFDEMLEEFDFHEEPRNWDEIHSAEEEFFDRVWYDRSRGGESSERDVPDDIRRGAARGRARVEAKYGAKNLGPYSDFEWGMINGKLSALRWVTGSEWDFLDT